jgi:formylglycine-generating enzyme required for sulfatase activity
MMTKPKRLGKYEILEEIGRGGFAVVYRAHDTELDRVVALKVLHPQLTTDPKFIQRFYQEARTAAGLRHPHIVTIHDVGEEAGQHYLAMAFLPGRTLDKRLAEGPLPAEEAISIVEQVGSALDAIHEQGLVHRDVKPGNITVDDAGQATLLDFGIVRAAEGTRLTTTMAVLGTPEYMAPEQAEIDEAAEVDWRADIYALGVVAYQMLVGRPPFAGRSPTAVLYKHVHEPPPAPSTLNPDLPAGLEPVLLKALAKGREERFQQAGAFAAELRRALLTESQIHEREVEVAQFYERLQAAATAENWAEVLTLGARVQALDADYRDAAQLVARARERLQEPRRRPMATWVRWAAAGGAILVLLVGLGVGLGPRLFGTGPASLEPEAPAEAVEEPAGEPGTTRTRSVDGMVMVHVPGGTFQMGSAEGDPDAEEIEFPQHAVTLDGFWIDQTEVTNAQYRQCEEAGACQAPSTDCEWGGYEHAHRENHPVVCVDWYMAAAYCEWVGARLLTEAEWEYAARGPDNFIYPWGDSPPDNTLLNYGGNVEDTTEVGSYLDGASWCGVLDLAGNVWEWVADWYGKYTSEALTNPAGPPAGTFKVVRGGSFADGPTCTRAAHRYHDLLPDDPRASLGFRCAGQAGE